MIVTLTPCPCPGCSANWTAQRGSRRRCYQHHRLIADGTLSGGIACDHGAAAHLADDTLTELIADRPTASAYRVCGSAGSGVTETALGTRFLGETA